MPARSAKVAKSLELAAEVAAGSGDAHACRTRHAGENLTRATRGRGDRR
jgi:hypothetical protein